MPEKLIVGRPADFVPFRNESILQGIHQRIEQQARLYPRNKALVSAGVTYTYAEMNGLANSLAAEILAAGGTDLGQVAILQPNDPDLVVSMLACLKAHKAYVPLDSNFPEHRLRVMLEDSQSSILLTDHRHISLAGKIVPAGVHILDVSGMRRCLDAPNPDLACDPLDRAYILYTSGSTGKPKGIEFLHRNLLHTTMCLTNELGFAPSDRVTWLHSPSFGASVVDIYCCLTNGAALYPWDPKIAGFNGMAEWMVGNQLTTFQWIPSAFRQFLRTVPSGMCFSDVRIVVMASEPLTRREVELFRNHFPEGSYIVNQVGTGESYNYCLYPVDHHTPLDQASIPGGFSVSPDREVLILDDHGKELLTGDVGQIAVRSQYMSAGYWRDPAQTQAKFTHLGDNAAPVYLTGDLGKLLPDGCLLHLGREDFQVKIRGFRVEMAEIDQALVKAPGVLDAATWTARNRLGENQLVAYLMLEQPDRLDRLAIRHHLQLSLPDYMIPAEYVVLDRLPVLPSGKTDRRALPNPFDRRQEQAGEIRELFAEVLECEEIGPDSDFIECGGDSLLSAVLLHRVRQRFRSEIPLDAFLNAPTPRSLAALVGHTSDSSCTAPTRTVQATVTRCGASDSRGNVIIIGAGQLGREVFAWTEQAIRAGARWRIKGFLDDCARALDGFSYPAHILSNVQQYRIEPDDLFIGAIGNPRTKMLCLTPILERGGRFINLVHPLANMGNNVTLGTGIVLAPFSSVTSDLTIGSHVNIGAFSNAGHDTVVGDWCQIGSHCGINGAAQISEGVTLGSHACIIPRVKVGAWAFVGAGSVVLRDVPDGYTVFGNPAAPVSRSATPEIQNHVS